jgi:cation:H+ antiporter
VLSRDGLWFLACSLVLIFFLFQPEMHWWMAVVLMLTYGVYVAQLYYDAQAYRRAHDAIHKHLGEVGPGSPTDEIVATLRSEGVRATPRLVDELRRKAFRDEDDEEEEENDSAGALFGFLEIPLGAVTTPLILIVSTAIAAVACYWLVEVTNTTAHVLNIPPFFVAVIVAAAASSVPDTFLSVMAARRGDDSGAVSNAFGSSIFDICISLSIPLLINCGLNDWEPIALVSDDKPMAGLVDLRILLCLLTVVTLLIMWHNLQLTRRKAIVLCALYGVFIAYAVLGSLGISFSAMLGFG